MAIHREVILFLALVLIDGAAFGESAFIAAVRYSQQLADAGQYNAAVRALELALKGSEVRSDPHTLAVALNELGRLYTETGRPSEARKSLLRSVELFQGELGAGCQEAQEALINLSDLYVTQGKFAQAQNLLEQVLQAEPAVVDEVDDTRGTLYTNLANVHLMRGDVAGAEHWANEAIRVLTTATAPSPLKIAAARHILGLVKAAKGDTRGALAEVSETITGLARAGFADHPEIVPHLLNLAGVQMQLREWAAAEIPINRALAIVEARLGETHPWRADAFKMLSEVYRETGRPAAGKHAMKHAESIISAYRRQNSLDDLVSIDELSRRR